MIRCVQWLTGPKQFTPKSSIEHPQPSAGRPMQDDDWLARRFTEGCVANIQTGQYFTRMETKILRNPDVRLLIRELIWDRLADCKS